MNDHTTNIIHPLNAYASGDQNLNGVMTLNCHIPDRNTTIRDITFIDIKGASNTEIKIQQSDQSP